MADLKISQLNPGNPAQPADLIPIARNVSSVETNFSITAGAISAVGGNTFFTTNFAGADMCLRMQAALTAAGNKNAVVDARGETGTQTCSVNPLVNLTNVPSTVVIYMPCQRINTTVGWAVPVTNDVRIIGCGKQGGSVLAAAAAGYPANTPLITVGASGSQVFSVMIQDWRLDCSPTASTNCQAYVSFGINEHSGMQDMTLLGQNSAGATAPLASIGDTVAASAPGHYTIRDIDFYSVGANNALQVFADGADMGDIDRITCNNTGKNTGVNCIHFQDNFGSGHTLNAYAEHVHAEGFTTTVFFDTATFGHVVGADCTGTCSNVLSINSVYTVSAMDLNSISSGVNIINNTNTQCVGACIVPNSTDGHIAFYAQSAATNNLNQTFIQYKPGTVASQFGTASNCSSSASPAVCGNAAAGSVAIPAGSTTLVVNTTAVSANSQIMLQADDTLGTKLGVTCNSTLATLTGGMAITSRSSNTSFTITFNGVIATNPLCVNFFIVN